MRRNELQIAIVLFALVLLLPLALRLMKVELEDPAFTRKVETKLPAWPETSGFLESLDGLKYFAQRFSDYYREEFALKAPLFSTYRKIQHRVFDRDPIPREVVRGDSGWYFLGNHYSKVVLESKGLKPFSTSQLKRIRESQEDLEQSLSRDSVEYCLAIAPNKHEVYGQHLPITKAAAPTPRQQVQNLGLSFTQYLGVGLSAAPQQTFHRTNSHWNDYGAFSAYQKLLQKLNARFRDIPVLDVSDLQRKVEVHDHEDLAKLLRMSITERATVFSVDQPQAVAEADRYAVPPDYRGVPENYELRYVNPEGKYKVLIFRDSFMNQLLPFINASFAESVYIWSERPKKAIIEQEKPDVVIHELVARNLEFLLPDDKESMKP